MNTDLWLPSEAPRDECGLFGVYNHPDAVQLTYLGLYALQHRGQESAGICAGDGEILSHHKGMGLVGDVFNPAVFEQLKGHLAMGHVRYSTAGSSTLANAQPIVVDYSRGPIGIAHNGNITNARLLRDQLEARGSIFQSTSDSEIVIHLMASQKVPDEHAALLRALQSVEGAYTLLLLKPSQLIGLRDPLGFRPLWLGQLDHAYVLASETCALDLIRAAYVREVEPGEVLVITESGLTSHFPFGRNRRHAFCMFEHVYFARPDSNIFGDNVHEVRKRLGRELAREHPADAEIVIPIPDSGNSAAMGYAEASGLPIDFGITRNHYIGRTFLQPRQAIRDFGVQVKLNPIKEIIRGKRVCVVEDSIVRGTTTVLRMKSIRDAGAKEVHLRISCPPTRWPCHMGIDFATRRELIAANKEVEEIRRFVGVDTLGYLSEEGMTRCIRRPASDFCRACWTGEYPVPIYGEADKYLTDLDRRQEQLRLG